MYWESQRDKRIIMLQCDMTYNRSIYKVLWVQRKGLNHPWGNQERRQKDYISLVCWKNKTFPDGDEGEDSKLK